MKDQSRVLTRLVRLGAMLFVALVLPGTTDLAAAGQRAKLSADLEERLQQGNRTPAAVILAKTGSEAESIATRHNATITKRLRSGVVLQVPAENLAGLAADPAVQHLSGDAPVHRMMAVATRATGADQLWTGIAGLPATTGRGIGVAVIDSGVAHHKALKTRVVAALDFTGTGAVTDEYGHGTHVAGIIAGTEDGFAGMAPGAHIVSLR